MRPCARTRLAPSAESADTICYAWRSWRRSTKRLRAEDPVTNEQSFSAATFKGGKCFASVRRQRNPLEYRQQQKEPIVRSTGTCLSLCAWSCIRASKGLTTSTLGSPAATFPRRSKIKLAQKGSIWKINDFTYPVNTLMKTFRPWRVAWTVFTWCPNAWRLWSIAAEIVEGSLSTSEAPSVHRAIAPSIHNTLWLRHRTMNTIDTIAFITVQCFLDLLPSPGVRARGGKKV